MAKHANPGEMRTKVFFYNVTTDTNEEGDLTELLTPLFGDAANPIPSYGKWERGSNVLIGAEKDVHDELELTEYRAFTTRYSPKYKQDLIAVKEGDTEQYEVVIATDINDRHQYSEIRLKRRVNAR